MSQAGTMLTTEKVDFSDVFQEMSERTSPVTSHEFLETLRKALAAGDAGLYSVIDKHGGNWPISDLQTIFDECFAAMSRVLKDEDPYGFGLATSHFECVTSARETMLARPKTTSSDCSTVGSMPGDFRLTEELGA